MTVRTPGPSPVTEVYQRADSDVTRSDGRTRSSLARAVPVSAGLGESRSLVTLVPTVTVRASKRPRQGLRAESEGPDWQAPRHLGAAADSTPSRLGKAFLATGCDGGLVASRRRLPVALTRDGEKSTRPRPPATT